MVQEPDNDLMTFPDEMRHFHFTYRDIPDNEKLLIGLTAQTHLTVHFGTQSKVLDIHYTDERFPPGDERRWKTLLRIPHDVLEKFLPCMEKIVMRNIVTFFVTKKINLGKLKHHGCYLVRQGNFDESQKGLVSITNKGNKLKLAKTYSQKNMLSLYTKPENIKSTRPADVFHAFKVRRGHHIRVGIIWFHPEMKNNRPFFVSMKNFNRMATAIQRETYQKSLELGIEINLDFWNELKNERRDKKPTSKSFVPTHTYRK